jgi:hypothetical protein
MLLLLAAVAPTNAQALVSSLIALLSLASVGRNRPR